MIMLSDWYNSREADDYFEEERERIELGDLVLIYPESRRISEDEVISWAHDVKVNDSVDEYVRQHGPFETDEAYDAFASEILKPELEDAISILEDSGKATFRSRR